MISYTFSWPKNKNVFKRKQQSQYLLMVIIEFVVNNRFYLFNI